jgi:anti-anti-sigma factor
MNYKKIARSANGVQILEIHGRFDAHVVPEIKEWFEELQENDNNQILINMVGVHFIDTRALSTLMMIMKRCRENGGWFRICSLQQPVRIIIELMHLSKIFDIFEEENDALEASPMMLGD